MNTDYRVNIGFFSHHKTRLLKRKLGDSGIVAILALWAYAAQFRPDGNLSGMTAEAIEAAAPNFRPGGWGIECGFALAIATALFIDHQTVQPKLRRTRSAV